MAGLAEEFAKKVFVRVTKKENDARTLLCGEEMQYDDNGRQFFFIPAHQKEYIRATIPGYEIGEEIIKDDAVKK